MNFSRSLASIWPPDALGWPPETASLHPFVACSRSFGRFAFVDWCLADIPRADLFEVFGDRSMIGSSGFSVLRIEVIIPLTWYFGFR